MAEQTTNGVRNIDVDITLDLSERPETREPDPVRPSYYQSYEFWTDKDSGRWKSVLLGSCVKLLIFHQAKPVAKRTYASICILSKRRLMNEAAASATTLLFLALKCWMCFRRSWVLPSDHPTRSQYSFEGGSFPMKNASITEELEDRATGNGYGALKSRVTIKVAVSAANESIPILSQAISATCFSSIKIRTEFCSQIDHDINALLNAVARLRKRRNSVMLIARLPPELLGKIFLHLREDYPYRYFEWIGVSHVCSSWRYAALENAHALWAAVSFEHPGRAATFINRSGQLPLHTFIDSFYLEEGAELLLSQQHRVGELDIDYTTSCHHYAEQSVSAMDSTVMKLLSTPAPVLQSLRVSVPHDIHLPARLFGGVFPRLKHISLLGCTVPSDTILSRPERLQSLTVLLDYNLSDTQSTDYYRPSLHHFLDVLHDACNLRNLRLSSAFMVTPGDIDAPIIHLPRLETLIISCSTSNAHCIAYSHIIHPITTTVKLRLKQFGGNDDPDWYRTIPSSATIRTLGALIGQRISHQAVCLMIDNAHDSYTFTFFSKETDENSAKQVELFKVDIDSRANTKSGILHTFCDVLNSSHLEHLSIVEEKYIGPCLPGFRKWPALHTISLCGDLRALLEAMRDAARSVVSDGGEHNLDIEPKFRRPYLTALNTIFIAAWHFDAEIVEPLNIALQAWWERGWGLKKLSLVKCHSYKVDTEELRESLSHFVEDLEWDVIEVQCIYESDPE
ncbi:hypothetical protein H0H87_011300 [Tephrocybe sp. NHM501043]|nr:hypothetical protein H0H87_011300 [Tephrocybe sp. NHM501043]